MAATGTSEQAARLVEIEAPTPRPWAVCDSPPNDQWFAGLTIFCPAEGKRVADTSFLDSRDEANAAFIVHAVNAHDDLVKALELAIFCLDRDGPASAIASLNTDGRSALSRAKGAA